MKTNLRKTENLYMKQNFLSQDELFLLEYMKSFDRRRNQEWTQKGLWDVSILD